MKFVCLCVDKRSPTRCTPRGPSVRLSDNCRGLSVCLVVCVCEWVFVGVCCVDVCVCFIFVCFMKLLRLFLEVWILDIGSLDSSQGGA